MVWGYTHERHAMVELLFSRGITDPLVLEAMEKVRRHLFFPGYISVLMDPYGDHPCPIGYGQTISQPYIVAYMIEKLKLKPGDRVLEIGTGSGYQAAVLEEMGMEVYTIEWVPQLYEHAKTVLKKTIHLRLGDGWEGWPEEVSFRGIILSCAPERIPERLVEQLEERGRMILPLGREFQRLVLGEKRDGKIRIQKDLPVRFVPMIGSDGDSES